MKIIHSKSSNCLCEFTKTTIPKMKVTIVLIAALAVCCNAAPSTKSSLIETVADFVNILPQEEMNAIYLEYLKSDKEIQDLVAFGNSEEFKEFILDLEGVKEYQTFLKFLQSKDIDIFGYFTLIHEMLDMPPYVPPTYRLHKSGKGVQGMLQDFDAIVQWDKIRDLSIEKYETSDDYRNLYDVMNSPVYKKLYCDCEASAEYQRVMAFGKQHGYDADLQLAFNMKIFNLEVVHC